MKRAHQTHYEQMGTLKGTVEVEGYSPYHVQMNGYRDHSYGKNHEGVISNKLRTLTIFLQ